MKNIFEDLMFTPDQKARKTRRFELKYLVPMKNAERFQQEINNYLIPDSYGDSHGSYAITSLYYDSPEYRCYWEKIDDIRFRRKLRIRHYHAATSLPDEAPVFVEIKQHLNRMTQKRRVRLNYRDARLLCNQRQIPQVQTGESAVIEEIASMLWQNDLQPVSLVSFNRQAFNGTEYDADLRVTFDDDLTYRDYPNLEYGGGNLPLLPHDWVVIEIKVSECMPAWLTELVYAHDLNPVCISKYSRSIEMTRGLPVTTTMLVQAYT